MRKIYLIRHCKMGHIGSGRCISQSDFSLSQAGIEQAKILKTWACDKEISHIFSSPLKRCNETASYISKGEKLEIVEDLTELSVGKWEGYTFSEIKEKWPEEYRQRGMAIGTTAPPGGESFVDGGERLNNVIHKILKQTDGNLVMVTHSGILRGWLCKIAKISADRVFEFCIPCGSITEVCWDGQQFHIDYVGMKHVHFPGEEEVKELYENFHTPENVQAHCMAVAKKALELSKGTKADRSLLYKAALLHDLCRVDGKKHPLIAAKILSNAGYDSLAQIIAVHHNLPDDMEGFRLKDIHIEAEILYLADKLMQGTLEVSLEERFESSKQKCKGEVAMMSWQKRFHDAKRLEEKYNNNTRKEGGEQ